MLNNLYEKQIKELKQTTSNKNVLCRPLQNNMTWLSSACFGEREARWLILRISFLNWTLYLNIQLDKVFKPIDTLQSSK